MLQLLTLRSIFRTYGHLPAFLFSWTSNFVLKPGGMAIASIVCIQYLLSIAYSQSETPNAWLEKGSPVHLLHSTHSQQAWH